MELTVNNRGNKPGINPGTLGGVGGWSLSPTPAQSQIN